MRIAAIRGRAFFVDVVSGEPPFGCVDRFNSSSGWPSFTKLLAPENVVEIEDNNHSVTYLTQFSEDGAKRLMARTRQRFRPSSGRSGGCSRI
jgi:peptide methionine sulfoxide reductase MsrB